MAADVESPLHQREARLSKHMWTTILEVVRFRSLTHLAYAACIPGQFILLINPSEAVRADALEWCSLAWKTIMHFEKKRFIFKECLELWNSIPQVEWNFCREVLCMLWEFDFKFVPPAVVLQVQTCFGLGSTLANEGGFQAMQRALAATRNKQLSNLGIWKSLAEL